MNTNIEMSRGKIELENGMWYCDLITLSNPIKLGLSRQEHKKMIFLLSFSLAMKFYKPLAVLAAEQKAKNSNTELIFGLSLLSVMTNRLLTRFIVKSFTLLKTKNLSDPHDLLDKIKKIEQIKSLTEQREELHKKISFWGSEQVLLQATQSADIRQANYPWEVLIDLYKRGQLSWKELLAWFKLLFLKIFDWFLMNLTNILGEKHGASIVIVGAWLPIFWVFKRLQAWQEKRKAVPALLRFIIWVMFIVISSFCAMMLLVNMLLPVNFQEHALYKMTFSDDV
jgi:hypothetical protein